ncbi:Rho termination factor N-terminal domain-containing protein [Staphylococcus cornubiensis]|uniref:Rho termination factor N-terminal domain-containing protein n=1 Tax=Staphylococcus cornubiensis TaxID=1986155 RepID=UPI000A3AC1B1|nr:Rho termination factor N-terminal domain-containing protein [Staphylococcus cornubiensis]
MVRYSDEEFEEFFSNLTEDEQDELLHEVIALTLGEEDEERSIVALLDHYTIEDIKKLCKQYGITGYSGMNKSELLIHFITHLVTPKYIRESVEHMSRAHQLLLVLTQQMLEIGIPFETTMDVPQSFLMYKPRKMIDDTGEILIPHEIDTKMKEAVQTDETLKELSDLYRLLIASVELYGSLPLEQLQVVYQKYMGQTLTLDALKDWLDLVEEVNPDFKNYVVEDGNITHIDFQFDQPDMLKIASEVTYYLPETKEEMLIYSERVYGIDPEQCDRVIEWVKDHFIENEYMDFIERNLMAEELGTELLLQLKHLSEAHDFMPVLEALIEDEVLDGDAFPTGLDLFDEMLNHMRRWLYLGHTSEEFKDILNHSSEKYENVIDFHQYQQRKK